MDRNLLKFLLFILVLSSAKFVFAVEVKLLPRRLAHEKLISLENKPGTDTASKNLKHTTKICSCQILVLQTSHKRQRNFALFAERTNKRSFASDVSFANRVIEREKRHMQSFFYDKLEVVGSFSDAIDCKSMFKRLKDKNKSIFLYDILDADIRR